MLNYVLNFIIKRLPTRMLCLGLSVGMLAVNLAWGAVSTQQIQQQIIRQLAINSLPSRDASGGFSSQLIRSQSKQVRSQVALVFFFLSTCPHCQRFSPIVKNYALAHHKRVYAFSLDGGVLPDFPHPLPTLPTIRQAFFGQRAVVAPTLFLVNVNTLQGVEITQGEISVEALNQKMNIATQQLMESYHES